MRNTLEELKISYPESPLNLDHGGTRGPKPGERSLDATVVRAADRSTVTLNDLGRGRRSCSSMHFIWRTIATG
jgi:3-(3-hydroxy-phenyl)propionate hydroxylase